MNYRDINAIVYGRAKNRHAHGLIPPVVDVLVGGFPCQDVSVAGQRRGLDADRSGLFFALARLIRLLLARHGLKVVVIENVPGLLSIADGLGFLRVLRTLDEGGLVGGWRVLDSQYFGVPQRRDRVFLIGGARGFEHIAEAVLFDATSGAWDLAAGVEAGAGVAVAATLRGRSHGAGVNEPGRGGEDDANLIAYALGSHAGAAEADQSNRSHASGGPVGLGISEERAHALRSGRTQAVAFALRGNERNTSQGPANYIIADPISANEGKTYAHAGNNAGRLHNVVATLNSGGNDGGFRTEPGEHLVIAPTLDCSLGHHRGAVGTGDFCVPVASSGERARALTASMHKRHDEDTDTLIAAPVLASAGHHGHSSPRGDGRDNLIAPTLQSKSGRNQIEEVESYQPAHGGVRRLTPLECERLQGFPDGWTCLCGEGHRGTRFCSCPDTPRYKALGNAVTVNVAEWLAHRIATNLSEAVA